MDHSLQERGAEDQRDEPSMGLMHRPRQAPQPFYLMRTEDQSGVSGTGIVAIGVVLPSGKAVMEWCSKYKTITVFESVRQIERIHGHGGRTTVIFGLPTSASPPYPSQRLLTMLRAFGLRTKELWALGGGSDHTRGPWSKVWLTRISGVLAQAWRFVVERAIVAERGPG